MSKTAGTTYPAAPPEATAYAAILSAADIAAALNGRRSGNGWSARCPAHDDQNPSLSIHEGDDGRPLVHCHTGCSQEEVIEALRSRRLWEAPRNGARHVPSTTITDHPYRMADDSLLVTVRRREGPDGKKCGDPPIWRKPAGVKPPATGYPLYRLGSLLANPDKPLLVVEGEKTALCAQDLFSDRYEATTSIGGAGAAKDTDWTPARGRAVVGWPDAEKPDAEKPDEAREHIEECLRLCLAAGATDARIVDASGFTPDNGFPLAFDLADRLPDDLNIEAEVSSAHPVPIRADERMRQFGTFAFMSAEELLTASDEGVAWLVDDMLPVGGFSMLVAKPKAGKSTLARTLAIKAARGEPWLGRSVRQGAVLYIALEEQRAVVAEHFRAMGTRIGDPLAVYVGPPPANPVDALIAACKANPRPALVIVDPLFRLTQIDDGNDYAKVTAALAPLVDLARETDAHVLTVHHGRKTGGDAGDETLGSTGLLGAVDCHLSLKRSTGGERYLSTLQRVGPDMPETLLTMDPETMAISAGVTKAARSRADVETLVVDHLRDTRHAHTLPELAKAVNKREAAVRSLLLSMVTQGRVVRSGAGKSGDPHRFEIVDDP